MKKYFGVFLLFFYASATLAESPISADVSAAYVIDDNVTRAWRSQDVESDNIIELAGSISYSSPINEISFYKLKATADLNQYMDFDGLNNMSLGLHASYHIRPSIGYTAAQYLVSFSYIDRDYDSTKRDATINRFQLGMNKRLTDIMSMRIGYINESVDATQRVFDADTDRLYFDLDYIVNEKNTAYLTLGLLDGDLVSTAPTGLGVVYWYWTRDDAFTNLSPPRWAYRVTGTTTSIQFGDVYRLDTSNSLDLSLLTYDSKASYRTNTNTYSGTIITLSYLHQF